MKVGTDGVLLGAWAEGGRRILDIGTGSGLIALMMAQRFSQASVLGIDIDSDSCAQALENIAASPFASRVGITCCSLQEFMKKESSSAQDSANSVSSSAQDSIKGVSSSVHNFINKEEEASSLQDVVEEKRACSVQSIVEEKGVPCSLQNIIKNNAEACLLQNIVENNAEVSSLQNDVENNDETYSLQDFFEHGVGEQMTFDSIVSNPPFFVNSLRNPDPQKAAARHTDSLPFSDLINGAFRLLSDDGVFSVIIPAELVEQFCTTSYFSGFYISRQHLIKTTERKPFKRALLAFRKSRPETFDKHEFCLQNPDGSRTDWYAHLTSDFYL
ncbi:MAG: methyltransferase [Prevotella sp.]|nr:methyltransferase [Prevotella sp.]